MSIRVCHSFVLVSLLRALLLPTVAAQDAFQQMHRELDRFVDDFTIAGAVTAVATHDKILDLYATGYSDLAARHPMRENALFWIASMTKPMTATAVLILQDEQKLSVSDPVEKYLPEFRHQWIAESRANNALHLVPAPRPITIKDLLTHTSGMGDFALPRSDASLAELVVGYSQQPLRYPPGTRWEYSNPGINTLGRIVEVVSHESFSTFLQKRLLDPLGMKDTTFWPTARQASRIAKSYKPRKDGGLEETSIYFITGELGDRRRTPMPSGGLFSTASDMTKFYQMMLSKGAGRGKRILSEAAVHEMTRTQSGAIKTGFVDGMSWGLGFQVVKDPQAVTSMLSPGSFGHGGAYATQSWGDPAKDLVLVLMIQRAGFPNGDNSPVRQSFQAAAVHSVEKLNPKSGGTH